MRATLPLVLAALALASCHGGSDEGDSRFRSIDVLGSFACAEREAGGTACWGAVPAELFGSRETLVLPTPPTFRPRFTTLTGDGVDHACGLEPDGRAWCWGSNLLGQLGRHDGVGTTSSQPPAPVATALRFRDIAADWSRTCGVTLAGELFCWGEVGLLPPALRPQQPACFTPEFTGASPIPCAVEPVGVPLAGAAVEVALGFVRACVRTSEGELLCWGLNAASSTPGALGVGEETLDFVDEPRPVLGGLRFEDVHFARDLLVTCATARDAGPHCWGSADGALLAVDAAELERAQREPVPVRAPDGATFRSVTLRGDHACSLDAEGRAWCWGANGGGSALGNAGTGLSAVPVAVLGNLRFASLRAGAGFTCGTTADGAWCWGENGAGQLGDGGTTRQPIPVRVAGQGAPD